MRLGRVAMCQRHRHASKCESQVFSQYQDEGVF